MIVQPLMGFAAGGLSILSPCVLPLAPLVLSAALRKGRLGPLALVVGLVFSFVATGYAVATLGFESGLDRDTLRSIGSVLLLMSGMILLSQRLQDRLAIALSPLSAKALGGGDRFDAWGVAGQAGIGALMGVVWSPCAGPTLGAAIGMASGAGSRGEAAAIMVAFGVGAALPLLAIGYGAGTLFREQKEIVRLVGKWGKGIMGGSVLATGVAILTGLDKFAEAAFVTVMPEWLLSITTHF